MIAVSYIMNKKIKKIFFEVISNSKIFNIIFFNEIVNDQDFTKLTGGTRQRGGLDKGGGLDSVEYGNIQTNSNSFSASKILEDAGDSKTILNDINPSNIDDITSIISLHMKAI